jgi:transcriptional regulator of heat shock response
MATKKEETASFVMRFTQKIFNSEEGEAQVQWRGHIRHVQSGDETRFSTYDEASGFVESKLSEMTLQAVEDKTPEEREGIVSKSLNLWKKVAANAPKIVLESIKDPKKQVAQIQEQLQEQIQQVGDDLRERINERLSEGKEVVDEWRIPTKSDYKNMMQLLEKLANDVSALNAKVDNLDKKKK